MNPNIGLFLKKEFSLRQKKNQNYSLRAFSRDLNVSPSFLSDVMNGKKKLSVDRALVLSQTLGWSWRQSQIFLQTAQLASVKSKRSRQFLKKEIQKTHDLYGDFQTLKLRHFSPISNWYYMAIMELTELPDFRDDAQWVAERLNISTKEAALALEQLKSQKLICETQNGTWQKTINSSVRDTPSADIRKFHSQLLTKAIESMTTQEPHERHVSGVTMAIDPSKLSEAVELIREFRSRMNLLLESGSKKAVYHLGVQLFQLDDSRTSKKSQETRHV
jgi:uncharacterized protein (TIGR02147 family)